MEMLDNNAVKRNETPEEFVKRRMIDDISVIIDIMNTFIPASENDRKQLLIGESMLNQIKDSLNDATTSAELSKILDIPAIRADWANLPDQLSDGNVRRSVKDWKSEILDKIGDDI